MLPVASMPPTLQRTTGSYASLGLNSATSRSGRSQAPPPRGTSAGNQSRTITTAGAVRPRSAERLFCSFDVDGACKHALATKQCMACIKFDPRATGYYCDLCFAKRHPYHREGHVFRLLLQRPKSPPIVAMKTQKAVQVANDTVDMLLETKATAKALSGSAEERLASVARGAAACDALLQRLAGSILQLRDEDFRKRQRAARLIQTCWRLRKGRKMRRSVVKLMWGRCLDTATGQYFYVNRKTGHTQWDKPTFAGRPIDVNDLPRVLASAWNTEGAASAIQSAWKVYRARNNIRRLIMAAYRKVTDKVTGQVYYFNMLSRKAQWRRPFALRPGEEPAEYIKYEDDIAMRAAAIAVQRAWRRSWGMRLLKRMLADKYERVLDPQSGAYFYFNKYTQESSWKKPMRRILGDWDVPLAVEPEAPRRNNGPTRVYTDAEARAMFKKAIPVWKARTQLRRLIMRTYRKVLDEDYGAYYWWNRRTGESSWTAPRLISKLQLVKRVRVGLAKLESEDPQGDVIPEESESEGEEDEEEQPEEGQQGVEVTALDAVTEGSAAAGVAGEGGDSATAVTADAHAVDTTGAGAGEAAAGSGTQASTAEAAPSASATSTAADAAASPTRTTAGGIGSFFSSTATGTGRSRSVTRSRTEAEGAGGKSGGRSPGRSKSRSRHAVEVSTVDVLRMHYNRLRAYYQRTLPGRVQRLDEDFKEHGTHLWTALEARLEHTTEQYVKGLPYVTSPWMYPTPALDFEVLHRPKGEVEVPSDDPNYMGPDLTEMVEVARVKGLTDSADPWTLGVVVRD